jgi:hypothetical protein
MENTRDNAVNMRNIIKYNNNVIENKDTDIICTMFKENGNIAKSVAVFILKYNLNQEETKPTRAILGKIELDKNTGDLSQKSKVVTDLLMGQLKLNNKEQNNYEYCKKLLEVCKKYDIPFVFTDEGIEIVTNDFNGTRTIEKTYETQENSNLIELINLNQQKKMDLYESELKIRKKIDEKIKSHKIVKAAMSELKDNEKDKFIKGKKISNLINETSKEVIIQPDNRNSIIDFLISDYESNEGKDTKANMHKLNMEEYIILKNYLKSKNSQKTIDPSMVIGEEETTTNAEKYFRLKEKGIAIDVRRILEEEQSEEIEQQNENDEVSEEQKNKNIYINNCKTIFDFIKQGRDFNTQFYYLRNIDGFEQLNSMVEKHKDDKDKEGNRLYNTEEILEYLKMKEEKLKTIKLDKKKSFLDYELYTNYELVRKFMRFVMQSDVRKDTREEEKSNLLAMYQEMGNKIIEKNEEELKLFNIYAERFNGKLCPVPTEKGDDQEQKENEEEEK